MDPEGMGAGGEGVGEGWRDGDTSCSGAETTAPARQQPHHVQQAKLTQHSPNT